MDSCHSDAFWLIIVSKIDHFKGPEVVVQVEGEDFSLPKALLCYNSRSFDRAFNGGFKETTEQKLSMTDCSIHTFKLVVQWMYTSQIILDEDYDIIDTPRESIQDVAAGEALPMDDRHSLETHRSSQHISRLLNFLKVTDRIELLGPFTSVVQMIKGRIIAHRSSLTCEHVRAAVELPQGHAVRELFAQACVRDYSRWFFYKSQSNRPVLGCETEVNELEGFAADLLKAFSNAIRKRNFRGKEGHFFPDPLTGEALKYLPGGS